MAGLGRKVFAAGDVLSAADVDGYLMDQTVQTFATSVARSSAVGTAVSEGMVAYLKATDTNDTANQLDFYNGSAWESVRGYDVAGKNKIINGGFDFWQRASSYTMSGSPAYGAADRWLYWHNGSTLGTNTISRQTFTPGAAPVAGYESEFFHRWTTTTLGTSQTVADMWQRIEDVRNFAGQTVTLSFWAKASSAFTLSLYLEQNFGSGGSSAVTTGLNDVTLSTSWQRFTKTITLPSISGKTVGSSSHLQLLLRLISPTAGSTFDIWGVQLEAGSVATPFSRAGGTIQGELAACQRYYQRYTVGTTYGFLPAGGYAVNTTTIYSDTRFIVPFRTAPTAVEYGGSLRVVSSLDAGTSITGYTLGGAGIYSNGGSITTASGLIAGGWYKLQANNDANAYIGFTAEL